MVDIDLHRHRLQSSGRAIVLRPRQGPSRFRNSASSITSTPSVSALVSLEPGVLARHYEVGLLRHARCDTRAGRLRQLRPLLTRHRGHRSGEDDRFPDEGTVRRLRGGPFVRHPDARRLQPIDERQVLGVVEPFADRRGDLRTDARYVVDLVDGGSGQRVDRAERRRQQLRDVRADVADVQPHEQPPERPVLGALDLRQQVRDRLLREPVELFELLGRERVDVGGVLHQPLLHERPERLVPEALDVQGAPAREVEQPFLSLAGAAAPCSGTCGRPPLRGGPGACRTRDRSSASSTCARSSGASRAPARRSRGSRRPRAGR